ncbi:MAG: Na+/H+ antiporter subunit E [Bacteroidota bacterium]
MLLRILHFLNFVLYYLMTAFQANIALAAAILAPKLSMSTTITDIKLKTRKESHILALSNLLSMTPGSLTLDYDEESNSLKIHVMYTGDIGSFHKSADDLQRMVMRIF